MIRDKINGEFMYYLDQGKTIDAYNYFGAHLHKDLDGQVLGCEFVLLAPNAKRVSVVGEFNHYDENSTVMERINDAGIYYAYVSGNIEWSIYKYRI